MFTEEALGIETEIPPKFSVGDHVIAFNRPALVVRLIEGHSCGAHPNEYGYGVRFIYSNEDFEGWPYCESQLRPAANPS